MSPLRIIILALLGYLFYKLLTAGLKEKNEAHPGRFAAAPPAQDVLVEDPVCKVYIPMGQGLSVVADGQRHYFCSEQCRRAFLQAKEKYR